MLSGEGHAADWKDAAAYAPLLQVGRAGFAWEWLRRDDSYRAAAARAFGSLGPSCPEQARAADALARIWGLHAFERPCRNAVLARPMWRREIFPYVLEAAAADEGDDEDRLDLDRLKDFVTLIVDPSGSESLLLSNGFHAVRVDIVSGTLRSGPVRLRYRLEGFRVLNKPLLALYQLVALSRTGRFSPMLHPRERRARRWVLLLRTYDALIAGASQREIAESLLGLDIAEERWRVTAGSVRSRAQRLVREARIMAAGGYLSLLSGADRSSLSRPGQCWAGALTDAAVRGSGPLGIQRAP